MSKVANKVANRAKKQQQARESLLEARKKGPITLAIAIVSGNQYVRNVRRGEHGAARFDLTGKEEDVLGIVEEFRRYATLELHVAEEEFLSELRAKGVDYLSELKKHAQIDLYFKEILSAASLKVLDRI